MHPCVILVVSTLNKTYLFIYLLFIHIEINKGTFSHQSKHEKMEKNTKNNDKHFISDIVEAGA